MNKKILERIPSSWQRVADCVVAGIRYCELNEERPKKVVLYNSPGFDLFGRFVAEEAGRNIGGVNILVVQINGKSEECDFELDIYYLLHEPQTIELLNYEGHVANILKTREEERQRIERRHVNPEAF